MLVAVLVSVNGSHYVAVVRDAPLNSYLDTKAKWVRLDDDKAPKTSSLRIAVGNDDPTLLFYAHREHENLGGDEPDDAVAPGVADPASVFARRSFVLYVVHAVYSVRYILTQTAFAVMHHHLLGGRVSVHPESLR